jgi:acetolactate synthase I/II/III large subunit
MNGAQALTRFLERQGTRVVWGLCGHTNVAVLAALEQSSIRFVGVHHEQMASHAADGWSRVTGELGVVLTHLGPGLTNALTGVANAALDNVPMLVVSGNVQSYFFGRHAHMESTMHGDADQAESFAPFCKRVWRIDQPAALVPALEAAARTALSGVPGPVLVDVAMDVFSLLVPEEEVRPAEPPAARPGLDPAKMESILGLLEAAERPVVYAGSGVATSNAGAELRRIAERFSAPIAYSLMGKGAVPDSHPLVVGMTGLWGTPAANAACVEADVILAVGTRFAELDTSSWRPGTSFAIPPTKLIHIHVDPLEIGRSYPVEIGAVADSGVALRQLAGSVGGSGGEIGLSPDLARMRDEFAARVVADRTSDAFPLHPARLIAGAATALGGDGILVGDTGWNKNGVGQQLEFSAPGRFVVPGGYATMGFGPAAALGTALGAPDRRTLALVGDGAFLTNISVVVTAVEEQIPVTWVVMNNGTYATISGMEKRHFGTEYGAGFDSSTLDYAAFARSVGAEGVRIEEPGRIEATIAEALDSGRPTVIDAPCGTDHVPTTGHWDINDLFARGFQ